MALTPLLRNSALALLALGATAFGTWLLVRPSAEELGRRARQALARGEKQLAADLARQALARDPDDPRALVASGDLAAKAGDHEQALGYYDRVADAPTLESIAALTSAGDLLAQQGRMYEAEKRFRRALALDPDRVVPLQRLAAVLVMSGQRQASGEPLFRLVRLGENTIDELSLLGSLEQIFDSDNLVDRFRTIAPDDPLLLLGAGTRAVLGHRSTEAVPLLREALEREPGLLAARLQLGEALLETGALDELSAWHAALPPEARDAPDYWVNCARYARETGQVEAAIRCAWEAARREPNVLQAHAMLAQLLATRGDNHARHFLKRAEDLRELLEAQTTILRDGPSEPPMLQAARACEALSRLWEAWAWYRAILQRRPGHPQALQEGNRIAELLTPETPQTLAEGLPSLAVDFSAFPLPEWSQSRPSPAATGSQSPGAALFAFRDDAQSAGINFTYDTGDDPKEPGLGIWQSVGGGLAAVDYDGDGWCDLHFAQGGAWPEPSAGRTQTDRLFRNRGTGTFEDVTDRARIVETGFSHGVTAGDYDNDGFADLFVANIGENHLYHNNGDGTFTDVTQSAGLGGGLWSVSCALADLNGDSLPDLYEVTYLAGRSPFTEVCFNEKAQSPRGCSPRGFTAEHDRLFLNRGDGTFADVSEEAGIRLPEGKGLGLAIFRLEGHSLPAIYVANDTEANFLFVNTADERGGIPRFEERAALAGCAYDANGRTQASMGIALADADGDGRLDLAVTSFYHEYIALYSQQPGEMFLELAGQAGLKEPSSQKLGFGAQFLDADCDSRPDLLVVNGHVDDYGLNGEPYRMPPQFFSNQGRGRFREEPARTLGAFFSREQLGRGLARLDWNRDGRDDVAVSHLDTPAALLTNQTAPGGHSVVLSFRGVESDRDAIGVQVRLTVGDRAITRELTAGDGFCASNQRQLVIGLGEARTIDDAVVTWPSGRVQPVAGLQPGSEWLIIEGRDDAVPLSREPVSP